MIFTLATFLAVSCRPTTVRDRLLQRDRQRLLQLIKNDQQIRGRFAAVVRGTPSGAIVEEFGQPSMVHPCNDADHCWYYEISNREYFVCFDKSDRAVCKGTVSPISR